MPYYGGGEMDMAKSEAGGPPLPAGEQEVTAIVNVSYEVE